MKDTANMEKLIVKVDWCNSNFVAEAYTERLGSVLVTARNYDELLASFADALEFHIEGLRGRGIAVPDYELSYEPSLAATLQRAEKYTTLTAISGVTGIKLQRLNHYAAGKRIAKPDTREKIIRGINQIGGKLESFA